MAASAEPVLWLSRSSSGVQPAEVPGGVVKPVGGGRGVRAEGLQMAFLLVEKESAVEAEETGFGAIDEAGGIVGAHLEEDAHLEFAEGLAAEEAVDGVIGVARGDDVEAQAGAFADQAVEDRGRVGRGGGIGGETEIVVIAEAGVCSGARG